ncbi:MAG: GGDEF domain-containing protein, partial [Gallionellaceae bacterium]|nr:GGDEF domain-containing protein [Gallionellaceae bacterium]
TIMQQATHDELTGLPNRRLFYDRLAQAIAEARRYSKKVAVIFIDLDHFKNINDTLGHEAGDQFLIAITGQLKTVPREIDTCARLGGDEFALILPSVESKDQVSLATQRILGTLDREFTINGIPVHASASIGVAIFPDDATDMEVLLKCADTAMYHSKEDGRNKYCFWDNTMAGVQCSEQQSKAKARME